MFYINVKAVVTPTEECLGCSFRLEVDTFRFQLVIGKECKSERILVHKKRHLNTQEHVLTYCSVVKASESIRILNLMTWFVSGMVSMKIPSWMQTKKLHHTTYLMTQKCCFD